MLRIFYHRAHDILTNQGNFVLQGFRPYAF